MAGPASDAAPLDVLVVGAGIAGAACARRCADAGLVVRVVDRGRRPGGRLAVRTLHDVPAPGRAHPVDMGAAGFAVSNAGFGRIVEVWRDRGLVRDWTDALGSATAEGLGPATSGRMQLASPGGLRTVVEDVLTGLDVRADTVVETVGPGLEVLGHTPRAVVLAMPGPQAVRLLDAHPGRRAVAGSAYVPGMALLARWSARTWPVLDRVEVDGVPAVRLIVDDGRRRGDDAPVLVAHASIPFAAAHLADPPAAIAPMVAGLRQVLGIDDEPVETRVQRWTFSTPAEAVPLTYDLAGGIGLCGDGWSSAGGVEGAWCSGDDLGAALIDALV